MKNAKTIIAFFCLLISVSFAQAQERSAVETTRLTSALSGAVSTNDSQCVEWNTWNDDAETIRAAQEQCTANNWPDTCTKGFGGEGCECCPNQ